MSREDIDKMFDEGWPLEAIFDLVMLFDSGEVA